MRFRIGILGTVVCVMMAAVVWSQDAAVPDDTNVSTGIQLRSNGQLAIGSITAEIAHYADDWSETMQHDAYTPKASPTTQPGAFVLEGPFAMDSDTFNLSERITPDDGGIHYVASVTSDKAVDTKELSLQLQLSTDDFGGKKVTIDGDEVKLPSDPQPKGQAQLSAKGGVHEIDIPTSDGTLAISSSNGMDIYLQDNREWDDDHFGLRIHFSPAAGQIKSSTLDLQIKVKAAGK